MAEENNVDNGQADLQTEIVDDPGFDIVGDNVGDDKPDLNSAVQNPNKTGNDQGNQNNDNNQGDQNNSTDQNAQNNQQGQNNQSQQNQNDDVLVQSLFGEDGNMDVSKVMQMAAGNNKYVPPQQRFQQQQQDLQNNQVAQNAQGQQSQDQQNQNEHIANWSQERLLTAYPETLKELLNNPNVNHEQAIAMANERLAQAMGELSKHSLRNEIKSEMQAEHEKQMEQIELQNAQPVANTNIVSTMTEHGIKSFDELNALLYNQNYAGGFLAMMFEMANPEMAKETDQKVYLDKLNSFFTRKVASNKNNLSALVKIGKAMLFSTSLPNIAQHFRGQANQQNQHNKTANKVSSVNTPAPKPNENPGSNNLDTWLNASIDESIRV